MLDPQSEIVGKQIAAGRARYEYAKDGKPVGGYIFLKNNGFVWKMEPLQVDSYGIKMEMLLDCMTQLEAMGPIDMLRKEYHHRDGQGPMTYGIKIVSTVNPLVVCNVVLQSSKIEDCDVLLSWFYDSTQEKAQRSGPPEQPVTDIELMAVEKAREEAVMKEGLDPVQEFVMEEEARVAGNKKRLQESRKTKGEVTMTAKKALSERLDFFGMPLMEEEMAHVGLATIADEPAAHEDDEVKVGEKEADEKDVKPKAIGDGKAAAPLVHGAGDSKPHDHAVAASKVKPGGPMDKPAHMMEAQLRMMRRQVRELSEAVKTLKTEIEISKKKNEMTPKNEALGQERLLADIGGIKIIHAKTLYGQDSRVGIHLKEPSHAEIEQAIETAQTKNFPAVYVHGKFKGPISIEAMQETYAKKQEAYQKEASCGMKTGVQEGKLKEAVLDSSNIKSQCMKIMSSAEKMQSPEGEEIKQACGSIMASVQSHEEKMKG
ncbi:MAG: hypothetical protein IPN68_10030 [Bacteroidetes bacterium]|nr:hypothetical protein [Bacteroidota bacterium]